MKEFFQEYFEVPEEGSVQEKVVVSRGIMTLVNILIILSVLAITAYAYFGVCATSPSIPVAAANFKAELSVSVTEDGTTKQLISGEIVTQYALPMQAGKTYTITLKPAGNANSGFCVLSASDCEETYYTQQLGADVAAKDGKTKKIQFTLIPTMDTVLTIDTSWGTSTLYGQVNKPDDRYVCNGESLMLVIGGMETLPVEGEPTQPTETTLPQEETTPAQTQPTEPVETTPAETEATVPDGAEPTQPTVLE